MRLSPSFVAAGVSLAVLAALAVVVTLQRAPHLPAQVAGTVAQCNTHCGEQPVPDNCQQTCWDILNCRCGQYYGGNGPSDCNGYCEENYCQNTTSQSVCGPGGIAINGHNCTEYGFAAGTLRCSEACDAVDTSQCTRAASCTKDSDCTAPDACHKTGTCQGGYCSYPSATAGTSCPNGACDAAGNCTPQESSSSSSSAQGTTGNQTKCTSNVDCKTSDRPICDFSGTCVAATSQSCTDIGGDCVFKPWGMDDPVCTPTKGVCQADYMGATTGHCWPNGKPEDTNGKSCTTFQGQSGTCQDENCVAPTDYCTNNNCATADQCHTGGGCDSTNGNCVPLTNKADGTSCNDGNPDTYNDVCTSGVCEGTEQQEPIQNVCGDGNPGGPGEQCDDGNNVDGDGCSSTCQIEQTCGNGRLDPGEDCDDGAANGSDGECDATCHFQVLGFDMLTVCSPPGTASTGSGSSSSGAGAQNGGLNTDIHNVNPGNPVSSGFWQWLTAAVGSDGSWPKMRLTLCLHDAPGGTVSIPAPKNAAVFTAGHSDPASVKETDVPTVTENGKRITYVTEKTVPVGNDFATWIGAVVTGNGGLIDVFYNPASEAQPSCAAASSSSKSSSSSSSVDRLHIHRVIDLRDFECPAIAVNKQQACPGDTLLYLATFADGQTMVVQPSVQLPACLDPASVGALEPENCTVHGTTLSCPATNVQDSLFSFTAKVKSTCLPGSTVNLTIQPNASPAGAAPLTVSTLIKDCGASSSRKSVPSPSSSRKSSVSSSAVSGRSSSSQTSGPLSSSASKQSSVLSSSSQSSVFSGQSSFPSSGFSSSVFSGQSSAPGSSQHSASSLSTSSFRVVFQSSSSSSAPGGSQSSGPASCNGNECALYGAAQCAAQGMACMQSAGSPCAVCVPAGFSSASYSSLSSLPPGQRSSSSSLFAFRTSTCGNSIKEPGEECDDGNTRDFDGCSADCLLERGTCGDGVVEQALGEQCEPSIHDASLPYGCDNTCHFILTSCGDGKLDPGEACDQGAGNSNVPGAYCRSNCSFARCGDGIVDALQGEECDDGNRVSGDGCSASCKRESGAGPVLGAQVYALPTSPIPYPQAPGLPQQQIAYAQPPSVSQTGPGSLAVMAGGAASGVAWIRRKRAKK